MTLGYRFWSLLLAAIAAAQLAGCAASKLRTGARDALLQQYLTSSDHLMHDSVRQAVGTQAPQLGAATSGPDAPLGRVALVRQPDAPGAFRPASSVAEQPAAGQPRLIPPGGDSPPPPPAAGQTYPIDLANALAMGGANHLQIQLARERVIQAYANLMQARALWLPSLRFGIGWNKHDGRLQETEGNILEISRNSLFVGGGAGLGSASLAGGGSGPARLMVNLSLADAIFERWVAERKLAAEGSAEGAVINDSLAQIAAAYFSLVEAHGRLANARVALQLATEMVKLTELFAREGAGSQAAVDLAKTEQASWQQAVQDAQRRTRATSAELARLLRIDPRTRLVPADENVVPIHLIDPATPLERLIASGLAARPELAQHQALVEAALQRVRQEGWRPWLPNVQVGASGGTFGGGSSANFENQSDRSDVDLLAVWEMPNLGFGVPAQRRLAASRFQQTQYQAQWVRDRVIAEIVTASSDVGSYQRQIQTAMQNVAAAAQSYQRNYQRVRSGEGLPIELLQAIRARAGALDAYTRAVSNYNRAQVRLLRSVGRPPQAAPNEPPPPAPAGPAPSRPRPAFRTGYPPPV